MYDQKLYNMEIWECKINIDVILVEIIEPFK